MALRIQAAGGEGAPEPIPEALGQRRTAGKFDEDEAAVRHPFGDRGEDRILLRQIFVERLAAPEDGRVFRKPEHGGSAAHRCDRQRRREPRQPHEPFAIMVRAIGRLHRRTAEEIIDRRIAGGGGMTPGGILNRREPHRCQPGHHRIHPHLGIDQDMRSIGNDGRPPLLDRHRALHEPIEHRLGDVALPIAQRAGMIADQGEAGPVQPRDPTPGRQAPDRMVAEMPADETDPDRLARLRRIGKRHRQVSSGGRPADEVAVETLQRVIVAPLIGQVERLGRADPRGERRRAVRIGIGRQRVQLAPIIVPAPVDLGRIGVKRRQMRHAQSETGRRQIRRALDQPAQQGDRIIGAALVLADGGEVEQRIVEAGLQGQRPLQALPGVGKLPVFLECDAERVEQGGVLAPGQGRAAERDSLAETALRSAHDRQVAR